MREKPGNLAILEHINLKPVMENGSIFYTDDLYNFWGGFMPAPWCGGSMVWGILNQVSGHHSADCNAQSFLRSLVKRLEAVKEAEKRSELGPDIKKLNEFIALRQEEFERLRDEWDAKYEN